MTAALLDADGITRSFSGLVAVDSVTFSVAEGQVHALIGPNGAGKTTLFNVISGLLPATAGSLRFAGRDIGGLPAHARACLGVGRTFQNIRMFAGMSVLENVMTGMTPMLRQPWPLVLLRTAAARGEERRAKERAGRLLELVGLAG